MTALVLVDTNVLLYSRDQSESSKQPRAKAWLQHLWQEQLGRTSMQVLSEYYYNVTRKLRPGLPPQQAWEDASKYFSWKPAPIDRALLERAFDVEQRFRLSWWDSMVVAAAQLQECAILLTEDLQDGAVFGGVTVRNPFTHNVNEPAATYAVHPVVASRHRGRGRPRKALTV